VKLEQLDPPLFGGDSTVTAPVNSAHLEGSFTLLNWLLTPEAHEAAALIGYLHRSRDELDRMQKHMAEQQRALEDERAVLQAKAAESERQIAVLRARIEELLKQAQQSEAGAAKQAERDQAVNQLNARVAAQNASIRSLRTALEQESAAHKAAAGEAGTKEAERAKLAGEAAELTRRAETCEAKNGALFKIGSELLSRFENLDFGDILTAREPFIGMKRVELENLVQDYRDKLLDQKVAP